MKSFTLYLATFALCAAPAGAQTTELYRIDKPAGILHGWGRSMMPISDVDEDGVNDLLVGIDVHGGGYIATVHSGVNGAYLYALAAPAMPLFYGAGYAVVRDESGDGIPELVAIGAHSGDSNSPNGKLIVYSGKDGALLREVATPANIIVLSHMQSNRPAIRDIDGDGYDEIFCRTSLLGVGGGFGVSLLSTFDGHALYTATPQAQGSFIGTLQVSGTDYDGDGVVDFALPVRLGSQVHLEQRSGATGAWLADVAGTGMEVLTGNTEPLIEIADVDGDGRRDIAFGNVFGGSVTILSSADGQVLQEWNCDTQPIACFGGRLVETGDLTGDGHPDLIALESNVFDNLGLRIFALDPVTGEQLFDQDLAGLSGGYTLADRIIDLGDLDPQGRPSFAVFEGLSLQVVVRSVQPELGERTCPGSINSSGAPAVLRARGTAELSGGQLAFTLDHAPAGQPAFFAFGSQLDSQPFGGGTLCIAGTVGRFPAVHMDASGRAARVVDLAAFGAEVGSTWTFQAVFRDPAGAGFSTSDALRIQLLP